VVFVQADLRNYTAELAELKQAKLDVEQRLISTETQVATLSSQTANTQVATTEDLRCELR